MEDRENIYYLKSFVKQHPDNRMAWYLLGKQYEEQGKAAKANYCYIQAGDIYEAFERKSHPLVSVEGELEQLKIWKNRKRARNMKLRAALLAVLLLLLMVSAPASPGSETVYSPYSPLAQQTASVRDEQGSTVVLAELKDKEPLGSSWKRMVSLGDEYDLVLAAQLEESENWRLWLGETRLLMSAETDQAGGKREVELYDPATCDCEPADAEEMEELLQGWSEEQEARWVLTSAIHAYLEKYGEWPSSLDALIRPYPDNVLAGENPVMRGQFSLLSKEMQVEGDQPESAAEEGTTMSVYPAANKSNSNPNAAAMKPLEVIVDKSSHLLAIVSGDIIVRSYEVGLGGDRTPEGEFEISEKVKNPNGTDKGPYGSRGLVLSGGSYAIHGTDEPESIGLDESLGCVRMERSDLEELYDLVPLGTKVSITKGLIPPDTAIPPENRFQLGQGQDETNPDKVYNWLS